MKRIKQVIIALSMLAMVPMAHADLYLKSAGDQWQAALQDLYNAYQEGVSSNDFSRMDSVLESRFTGSTTSAELIAAYKANPSAFDSVTSLNDYLSSISTSTSQADLDQEISDRKSGDDNLQTQIDDNNATQAKTDASQDQKISDNASGITANSQAISDEASTRSAGDAATLSSAKSYTDTSVYEQAAKQVITDDAQDTVIASNTSAIATNTAGISSNKAAISNEVTAREEGDAETLSSANTYTYNSISREANSRIAGDQQTLASANAYTNQRFTSLKNQVDKNKKKSDAGIAGVAAMANIPQVTDYGRFSVGAGVGSHAGESALAVGMSSRITDNVIGKASVATDSQSQWTVGAGVAVQW